MKNGTVQNMQLLMRYSKIVVISTVLWSSLCAANDWVGNYVYQHPLGDAASTSESNQVAEYKLTITLGNNCALQIKEPQGEDEILCNIEQQQGTLMITFISYADGGSTNSQGVAPYAFEGQLFGLVRKTNTLNTQWLALTPTGISESAGEFFLKVDN